MALKLQLKSLQLSQNKELANSWQRLMSYQTLGTQTLSSWLVAALKGVTDYWCMSTPRIIVWRMLCLVSSILKLYFLSWSIQMYEVYLCELWPGPKNKCIPLDWQKRAAICIGTASGLAFLHEEAQPRIVHRDIKASNILLDKKLLPKIGDFGLAKLFPDTVTHISTRVAGTMLVHLWIFLCIFLAKRKDFPVFTCLYNEVMCISCHFFSLCYSDFTKCTDFVIFAASLPVRWSTNCSLHGLL